jgi:hypothetical protein
MMWILNRADIPETDIPNLALRLIKSHIMKKEHLHAFVSVTRRSSRLDSFTLRKEATAVTGQGFRGLLSQSVAPSRYAD